MYVVTRAEMDPVGYEQALEFLRREVPVTNVDREHWLRVGVALQWEREPTNAERHAFVRFRMAAVGWTAHGASGEEGVLLARFGLDPRFLEAPRSILQAIREAGRD